VGCRCRRPGRIEVGSAIPPRDVGDDPHGTWPCGLAVVPWLQTPASHAGDHPRRGLPETMQPPCGGSQAGGAAGDNSERSAAARAAGSRAKPHRKGRVIPRRC
jgi:hypothetical protein